MNNDSNLGARLGRRQALKLMAAGGALATGVLTSCTKADSKANKSRKTTKPGQPVDVTLVIGSDWPSPGLPSAKEQAADPVKKAYAKTLHEWMRKNPGVKFKKVTFDDWNQQTLTTAITGGTAPSIYPANPIGSWGASGMNSAFTKGLMADITELAKLYKFDAKIPDYVAALWRPQYTVDGKVYGVPQAYDVGGGFGYRHDLVQQNGLKEPTPGWTLADLGEVARGLTTKGRKGVAFGGTPGVWWWTSAEGYWTLNQQPAPDTGYNWRYDFTWRAQHWIDAIEAYRTLTFKDKAVLTDVSLTDTATPFGQGRAAMFRVSPGNLTGDPDTANTPANLAKRTGKPFDEVIGWVPAPVGNLGSFGATQALIYLCSFSPDLSADALDKAVSFVDYFTYGDGYTRQKQATWEATKNLQKVWTDPTPVSGKVKIDGVPGSFADAWGQSFMDNVEAATKIPLVTSLTPYLPAEKNPGPSFTAANDAQSRWSYQPGKIDIRSDLEKITKDTNKELAGFKSSIPDDVFIKGVRKYFNVTDAFWAQHAPDYSEQLYHPYYETIVLPALGH